MVAKSRLSESRTELAPVLPNVSDFERSSKSRLSENKSKKRSEADRFLVVALPVFGLPTTTLWYGGYQSVVRGLPSLGTLVVKPQTGIFIFKHGLHE